MILIEGENEYLRRQVRKELRSRLDRLSIHADDEFEMTFPRLIKLLHLDNRYQVREQLTKFINKELGLGDAHMVASALQATGTFVLVCHTEDDINEENCVEVFYKATLSGLLPGMNIYDSMSITDIVARAMDLWEENLLLVARFYDTDIWSAGGVESNMVMLVGEKVHPYKPADEERRLAFVSQQSCCRFLHDVLASNFYHQGVKYYLTNAHKVEVHKMNLKMLKEELDLVKPIKVVAMGSEAARVLSDLGQEFTRTYHPQYWKRFKNQDRSELVRLLLP
jgi:hypothetical protein